MTDKFEDIEDDELIEEFNKRALECDNAKELQQTIDELQVELDGADIIQTLCEAFKYSPKEVLDAKVKNFLIDHGGLIA